MESFDFTSRIAAPPEAVFAWHTRAGAFRRLVPPWMNVMLERFEGIREGQQIEFRIGIGPLHVRWKAEHEGLVENRQFRDVQLKGPFSEWQHTHRIEPDGEGHTLLHDHVEYELPFGELGRLLSARRVHAQLEQQFAYRHRVTAHDVEAHHRLARNRPLRVAISGASGLIGSELTSFLEAGGHTVYRLVRSKPTQSESEIYWNYKTGAIEANKLEGLDAVVHLAAENVFGLHWSQEKKMRIYASRSKGTELIARTLAQLNDPPEVFLSASGIGYYGGGGGEILTEDNAPHVRGFLSAVCQEWESATRAAAEAGIRTVPMRFGVVMTPAGGALPLMRLPFLLGLGGTMGRKDLWMSWIAIDDLLHGLYHALFTDELDGPINLTSPHPVTMETLAQTLGRVVNRPVFLHVPGNIARLAMGEMAEEFLLKNLRAVPKRLQDTGFTFRYPRFEEALRHVLGYQEHFPDTKFSAEPKEPTA